MRSRRGRWGLALGVLSVVAAATGWALRVHGTRLAMGVLEYEVRQQLGAELQIDALRFSFVPPQAVAKGVGLWRAGRRWAGAESVSLRLRILRSLWAGAWVGDLDVRAPVADVSDREEIWIRLLASIRSGGGVETRSEAPFLARRVRVTSGTLTVDWSQPPVVVSVSDLSLDVSSNGVIASRFDVASDARVRIARGGQRLEASAVSLRGSVSPEAAALDRLSVEGPAGSLQASLRLAGGRAYGEIDAALHLDSVFALVPEAGEVRGSGRIRGGVSGTLKDPETAFDVEAQALRIHGVELSAHGRVASRGRAWTLNVVEGRILEGEFGGTARGTIEAGMPFDASAKVSRWSAAGLVGLFGPHITLNGVVSGNAKLRGKALAGDLEGDATVALEHGAESASGTVSFASKRDRVSVEGLLAGGGDRVRARFTLAKGDLGGDVEGEFEKLSRLGDLVGAPVDGAGSIRARFAGTVDRPVFEGVVDLSRLVVRGIDLGQTSGPFAISTDGARSAAMQLGAGEMSVSGQIALDERQANDFSVTLRAADLSRVGAIATEWSGQGVEGWVDGSVIVQGPWRAVRLSGDTRVTKARIAGEDFGDATLAGALDGPSWHVTFGARRADDASVLLRLAREHDGKLAGSAKASAWDLGRIASIHRYRPELRGAVEIDATVRGTSVRPEGDASIRVTDLAVADHPLGEAAAQLRSDGSTVAITARALGGVTASASISLSGSNVFRAVAQASDVDVAPLLPHAVARVKARLTGTAELSGDRRTMLHAGRATIDRLELAHEGRAMRNPRPIELRIADGRADLVDAVLEGDGQHVSLTGRWTKDSAELRLSANADLSLLQSLSEEIASARGGVAAEVSASREGAGPWRYNGGLKIQGGAIDLGLLVGITQIEASIELDERAVEIREMTGKLGGGGFLVSGSVSLDRGWDLGWAIREASLEVPSWLDYRASGNGRFAGALSHPTLAGEIEVDQAVYDQPIEWVEFLPWFRRQTRATPGKRQLPIALDLRLVADGGLFVDNNLAKAELRTDMQVVGEGETLAWWGGIEVLNGEFIFRRRRFTITSGTVTFRRDRSANPDLRFHGETHVSTRDAEYEIQVDVSGTVERPRIQFAADDPSLTENDVLALVTFGRTVSQLQSQGASIELGEVLKVTAGAEGGAVEKSIYSVLPVDRIEIEPSYARGSGGRLTREPRLSIAKDLTDRFGAVLGTGLGSERSQEVGLEYRVTRGFSLQTVWQSETKSQAGAIAGNLKVRVPFRTWRSFSLLPPVALRLP